MPTEGWFVNCGLLPIGAAMAAGSPFVCEVADAGRAQPAVPGVDGVAPADVGAAPGVPPTLRKLALAPEPAQPVKHPAVTTIVIQVPTVRVVMPVPLDSAEGAATRPPGTESVPPGSAAAAGSSLSAARV
jgi:hypothetical protein